jgi:hypothetical protein
MAPSLFSYEVGVRALKILVRHRVIITVIPGVGHRMADNRISYSMPIDTAFNQANLGKAGRAPKQVLEADVADVSSATLCAE